MGFFVKMRGPRKYDPKPIYYDPEKEQRQERIEKVKKEMGLSDESTHKTDLKGSIVDQSSHVKRRKGSDPESHTKRNISMAILLVLLLLLFYYIYLR